MGPERWNLTDAPVGRPAGTEMADEALAAGPDQYRDTGRHELWERSQELKVVADRLAEPDPRVDVDLRDTGGTSVRDASL
jgi:hypothetical protein